MNYETIDKTLSIAMYGAIWCVMLMCFAFILSIT